MGLKFKDLIEGKLYKHIGYENLYTKKEGLLFRVDYNQYADFSNPEFILNMSFEEMISISEAMDRIPTPKKPKSRLIRNGRPCETK